MAKILTILLVSLVFEAVGVVLLKHGIEQIDDLKSYSIPEVLRLVGRGLRNPSILLGVFFEALFFAGLLVLMSKGDISFIWPLTSLSFVMTTFAAVLLRQEHVSGMRWSGVFFIMVGAALITWSEKVREKPHPPAPLVQQSPPAAE